MCDGERKIAFILCTNDLLYMAECERYIGRLTVPEGYSVEVIAVTDAVSMCAGYNEAMRRTNAKYKIYMHQDTFILNTHFIENIITLFEAYPMAGMIGMVGSERLPKTGVMWRGKLKGALYGPTNEAYIHDKATVEYNVEKVECIDGFIMATQVDLPWREDIFDGWDFYDVSQSMEFHRAGYDVLVPEQISPWCLHDDGKILSLFNYNHYRKKFLNEYGDETGCFVAEDEEYERMLERLGMDAPVLRAETDRIIRLTDGELKKGDINAFIAVSSEFNGETGRVALVHSTELMRIKQMAEAVRSEINGGERLFVDGVDSYKAFRDKYIRCVFALRRIEMDISEGDIDEALSYLRGQRVSAFAVAAIIYNIISQLGHREKILTRLASTALDDDDTGKAYKYLAAIQEPSEDTKELLKELRSLL